MVLESIFSSVSKVQVLRVLSESSSALSPQELEKECTKNISVIYDAVRELKEEEVIGSVNPEGRKNYYRMNQENEVSTVIDEIFETEKKEKGLSEVPAHLVNIVFDARNKLKSNIEGLDMVMLFGSVPRGDFTPESDVDLYVVVEEKSVDLEDEVYDILENYEREFSLILRDEEAYKSEFGDDKSDLAKSIMLDGFSVLYSSKPELKEVLKNGLGLDYLDTKGLAEGKRKSKIVEDFIRRREEINEIVEEDKELLRKLE